MSPKQLPEAVRHLRSTDTIRERCKQLYDKSVKGELQHFRVDESKIDSVCNYVLEVIKENYPDLEIPYHSRWRHFDVGGLDRCAELFKKNSELSDIEIGRIKYELVITSVLLDAGAGPDWSYLEKNTDSSYARSEGLAVASFYAFTSGIYSSDENQPYKADAKGLKNFKTSSLEKSFQVGANNPLVGLDGRASLIRKLGTVVESNPEFFEIAGVSRLGHLFDYFVAKSKSETISALTVLEGVLTSLSDIWPGRIEVEGYNLGDAWNHSAIKGASTEDTIVPFHKLSQWLTYSLFEPLEEKGIKVTDIGKLTGLPEYRNGGLFIDLDVIVPMDDSIYQKSLGPEEEAIVEWRALTVCLLDLVGEKILKATGKSVDEFPLAKVLQGGTWTAGRKIAAAKRTGGIPPINIKSDGTVF